MDLLRFEDIYVISICGRRLILIFHNHVQEEANLSKGDVQCSSLSFIHGDQLL